MVTRKKMRHFTFPSIVLASLIADGVLAQTRTESSSQAVEPASNAPVSAQPTTAPVTADINDDIFNLLNNVSDRVDTTIGRATEARDRAIDARDNAADLVDNMQDGLQNLTGEMRARIQDAVETLQQAVLDELAGAAAFTNGPNSCSPECESFRNDLVTLLTSLQDISNALLALESINGQADLSTEIAFVESLSGKALYPLYRVLQTLPILDEDFLASMSQFVENLTEVAPYIEDSVVAGELPDTCRLLAENAKLAERIISAAKNISKVGKGFKMAGSVLSSVGKSKIAARAGVWGFAGITYTSGLLERFGKRIESIGERVAPIAEKVERKLQYCVLKVNGEDALSALDTNHDAVVVSQQSILDAVKALQAAQSNSADLNGSGLVDLADYAVFQNRFGSGGK